MSTLLLEMKGISKSFLGVKVLDGVNFSLYASEVHALMGENGAGKSTLIKILGGIYGKDEGTILIKGTERQITSPRIASNLGIAIIHQELNLIPDLTIAENLFLGREITFESVLRHFERRGGKSGQRSRCGPDCAGCQRQYGKTG